MHNQGYITLISVLMVGAVGAAVTFSLLLLGVGASRTSFAIEQSREANALAHACAEEALEVVRGDTAYTGSGNLSLGQGACAYTVSSTGSTSRRVIATGTVDSTVKRVEVHIDALTPQINVVSWEEVTNF